MGRVGSVEDVTERRQAEAQLRRSEERYRLLAEHSTDLISKHAKDGVYRYASPACRALLGYEPEELIGRNSAEFIHPEDMAGMCQAHASFAEPLHIDTLSCRMRRKDGSYIWFETTSKAIPEPGRPDGVEVIAVSRDITARRLAAEKLQASESLMRAILDTAPDGIITVNERGTIELFNPGAERLFGYRAEEVLGQDVGILLPDIYACASVDFGRSAEIFRQKISRTREVIGRRKDGTTCELELRAGETIIGGRSIFTGILHDVSQRRRTEQMLRESEKLAATGRIAARVAHEINNPLAGIKNSFLLLKDAIGPEHRYFSYVARIENEIARIARIVRQMFDLCRPDQVTLDEVDVGETIRDVVALLGTIAPERNVTIELSTDRLYQRVRLPEDSIRQVLYNVVINAIEASPEGGRVRVDAAIVDGSLRLEVRDDGAGIPPELLAHVYEPFFTTKRGAGAAGLGLGLSISRGIVEWLGGTLNFESSNEQGTLFRVVLPISPPSTSELRA